MYNNNWYARTEKQIWVKDDGTEAEYDTVVETMWTSSKESPWIQTTDEDNEACYDNVKATRHPGNYLMSLNLMSYGGGMTFIDTTRLRFTQQQKEMFFCKASQIPELKRILKTTTATEDKSVLYEDCLNAAQKQFPEDSIEELRGPWFSFHNLPNGCSHRRGSNVAYYSRAKNEDFETSYEYVMD